MDNKGEAMNITSKQLKQIIREEIERVYSEGFGEGRPADDELSQKRDVYLEGVGHTVESATQKYVELAKDIIVEAVMENKIDPQLAKDILNMLYGALELWAARTRAKEWELGIENESTGGFEA
jgi:hypothetical protein